MPKKTEHTAYHHFGGNWTLIKLEMLERYLVSFNTSLQNKPSTAVCFKRIFIDAFAGTGECAISLDGQIIRIDGSAKLALDVQPGFDKHYFIDIKNRHTQALAVLATKYPEKKIEILSGDGNEKVAQIIQDINWKGTRAVMFLDPYGMAVHWDTLRKIAATKAIDLWYLFPISAVCRQAAHQFEKIDAKKTAALTSLFGTPCWVEELYQDDNQNTLFSENEQTKNLRRMLNQDEILLFMQRRLKSIFPVVLDPIKLPDHGSPLFALFFASANPSHQAVKLTKRIAGHLLRMPRKSSKKIHSFSQLDKTNDLFTFQSNESEA